MHDSKTKLVRGWGWMMTQINRIHVRIVLLAAIAAYFAGGFVAGAVYCEGCDENIAAQIFGRAFVGCIFAVFSAIFFGFPPKNMATPETINVWPFIVGCWIAFVPIGILKWGRTPNATPSGSEKLK